MPRIAKALAALLCLPAIALLCFLPAQAAQPNTGACTFQINATAISSAQLNRFVKITDANSPGMIGLASSANDQVIGIIEANGPAYTYVAVAVAGERALLQIGGTVTIGELVTADGNGLGTAIASPADPNLRRTAMAQVLSIPADSNFLPTVLILPLK